MSNNIDGINTDNFGVEKEKNNSIKLSPLKSTLMIMTNFLASCYLKKHPNVVILSETLLSSVGNTSWVSTLQI